MTEHTEADSNSRIKRSYANLSDSDGTNTSFRCADLPDNLIIEVLSRLPVKTVLKFKCVSKSWRNLISNSTSPMSSLLLITSFCKERELRGMSIPMLPYGCSTSYCLETLQSRIASLRNSHPEIKVIHYCNGLFLLSNEQDYGTSYHVCNPATNQCVGLPEPKTLSTWGRQRSALVFDPRKSSDFKVVGIGSPFMNQVQGQIFSSDKNQWVSFSSYFKAGFLDYLDFWDKQPIYLNGALHFLCNWRFCMFRFYVEEKRFREMKVPSKSAWRAAICLGESKGRLFYADCNQDKLQIWMLWSFDTDKWFKKYTLHNTISFSPFTSYIMTFHANLEVLFIRHGGELYSHYFGNSGRKGIDKLEGVWSLGKMPYVDFVCPYSRCLASLNDICKWRST